MESHWQFSPTPSCWERVLATIYFYIFDLPIFISLIFPLLFIFHYFFCERNYFAQKLKKGKSIVVIKKSKIRELHRLKVHAFWHLHLSVILHVYISSLPWLFWWIIIIKVAISTFIALTEVSALSSCCIASTILFITFCFFTCTGF